MYWLRAEMCAQRRVRSQQQKQQFRHRFLRLTPIIISFRSSNRFVCDDDDGDYMRDILLAAASSILTSLSRFSFIYSVDFCSFVSNYLQYLTRALDESVFYSIAILEAQQSRCE